MHFYSFRYANRGDKSDFFLVQVKNKTIKTPCVQHFAIKGSHWRIGFPYVSNIREKMKNKKSDTSETRLHGTRL